MKSQVSLSRVWFEFELDTDVGANAFLYEPIEIAQAFPLADRSRWDFLRQECAKINKSRLEAYYRSEWVNCKIQACASLRLISSEYRHIVTVRSKWQTDTSTDPYLDLLSGSISDAIKDLRSALIDFGSVDIEYFDSLAKRETSQIDPRKATLLSMRSVRSSSVEFEYSRRSH